MKQNFHDIKDFNQDYFKTLQSGKHVFEDKNTKRRRVVTVINEPSLTDTQFKKDCDPNYIMEKFRRTGTVTHLNHKEGSFADVAQIPDLLDTLLTVEKANESFQQLSAKVRNRFGNNIHQMIEFMNDPNNREEAIELGIIEVAQEAEPTGETKRERGSSEKKTPSPKKKDEE